MIEKCFKCDGRGTLLEISNFEEWSRMVGVNPVYKSVTCGRCAGVGAVDYVRVEVNKITQSKAPEDKSGE